MGPHFPSLPGLETIGAKKNRICSFTKGTAVVCDSSSYDIEFLVFRIFGTNVGLGSDGNLWIVALIECTVFMVFNKRTRFDIRNQIIICDIFGQYGNGHRNIMRLSKINVVSKLI
jgi:hypothetical protein|tara:strand:- start:361 stop:705 length:345 start_codon:yes stop_codon:yes gene_type:complete